VDQNGRSSEHQGRIKLTILSLRGTSGERTEERGSEQERASSPHPLLHLMEGREKSTSLMQDLREDEGWQNSLIYPKMFGSIVPNAPAGSSYHWQNINLWENAK